MKHLLLLSLSFGLLLNAQNSILLGNKIINPSYISLIDTTVFYTKLNNINREIGLFESEIGAIYNIKKNYFHSSVYQYGYKHYKETIVKTASSKQISKNVFFGIGINFHHLYLYDTANYQALSFDMGAAIIKDRFSFYLLLKNPANSAYLENDIENILILSPVYLWTQNLVSQLDLGVSTQAVIALKHQLTYTYQNRVNLSLLQGLNPIHYGFQLSYSINKTQFSSQYLHYKHRQSTSIMIIYTLGND